MQPVNSATDAHATDAVSTVKPVTPSTVTAPASATAGTSTASAVDFSSLAQFLSTVGLTRRQLDQLQGGAASTPTAADLMLLNVAATNLTQSFNQLPPAAVDTLPPVPDRQGGALADRLAQALQQMGATAGRGGPVAGSTLAGLGITLDPLAPASSADLLNVDAPRLRAAFAADRDGVLDLLARTAATFESLGTAVAQAESAPTPAPVTAPPAAPGANAALAGLALTDALADALAATHAAKPGQPAGAPEMAAGMQPASEAELLRQRQLAVAREAVAGVRAETQADRLAADRLAAQRQLDVPQQEDQAARALAQRMEAQREAELATQQKTDLQQRAAALRQELDHAQSVQPSLLQQLSANRPGAAAPVARQAQAGVLAEQSAAQARALTQALAHGMEAHQAGQRREAEQRHAREAATTNDTLRSVDPYEQRTSSDRGRSETTLQTTTRTTDQSAAAQQERHAAAIAAASRLPEYLATERQEYATLPEAQGAAAMAAAQRAAEQRLSREQHAARGGSGGLDQQQLLDSAAVARQMQEEVEAEARAARQAGQHADTPRPPNAADPALAAAIAAYNAPAMAAAGPRPPVPSAQSARVPSVAPVPPVEPVEPVAESAGGNTGSGAPPDPRR